MSAQVEDHDRAESAIPRIDSRRDNRVRVLVVTGGHAFEEDEFFQMFDAMKVVLWRHARFTEGAEDLLSPEASSAYDVVVFYDMFQDPERHKTGWLQLMQRGKGMVFLHHALGSYRKWDEYNNIVGGRAWFGRPSEGDLHARSIPKQGVSYRVHIANSTHPITQGLRDFDLVDETYSGYEVNPKVEVLLTADHPDSGKVIGWTHRYKNSRIVYLQPGHDHTVYRNPDYRTLVERSILWTDGRLPLKNNATRP